LVRALGKFEDLAARTLGKSRIDSKHSKERHGNS
jgi:hypothetical protein